VLWGRSGKQYGRAKGLHLFADGIEIAKSEELTAVKGELP